VSGWAAYGLHAIAVGTALAILRAPRRPLASPRRWIEIAAAVAIACGLLALTSGPILIDFFKAYLFAGGAALSHPSTMYDCTRGQCFVNIPIVALLFVPLAPLGSAAAGLLFSAVGALLLLAAVRRMAVGPMAHAIVWLVLLSGPIYYSVRIGNTTHMLLLPLIIAFDRLATGRQATAGAMLAGAALLKPPLALFLPYFLLRRYRRAAIAMALCAVAAIATSVALFGTDLHWFWFREFVVNQGSRPIGAYNVQSVNGFLAHLLTRGHLRDWYPIEVGLRFQAVSAMITGAFVAAAAIGCWRAGRPADEAARHAELWLVLNLTVLIAPISWTHYDLLLLIPGAALLSRHATLDRHSLAGLITALALMAPPVVVLSVHNRIGSALYERLFISHYFAGAVVLLGVLIVERLRLAQHSGQPPRDATIG
jgi:alpha-1,2-mannosyltransferase